jgi:hypothetical protein
VANEINEGTSVMQLMLASARDWPLSTTDPLAVANRLRAIAEYESIFGSE